MTTFAAVLQEFNCKKVTNKKNIFSKYNFKRVSAFLVVFFLFFFSSYSATYYSKATGNWGTSSTWGTGCGSGGNQTPAAGDNVVICSGYTVTVSADKSITAITINSGGALVCTGSYTLTVSGATSISGIFNMSAGTFNSAGAFNVASGGVYNFSGGTLNSAGNLVVDGTMNVSNGSIVVTGATGTDNLLVNGVFNQSGGTITNSQFTSVANPGIYNLSGGSLTCTKVLKLKTGGVFNISNGTALISGGITSNNSSDRINQSGGTIQMDNTANWTMTGIYNATAGTAVFNGITTLTYSGSVAAWTFFNLTINSGKTFDQNSVININVKGVWTNTSGTYTHSGQRVTFNGTAAQSITGTTGTTFDSLTINNSSTTGVTLLKPVTISTILTLTDGYVYTDATNLMIVSNNATSTSGSNASFVSGPMKKVGNDPFVFPVGSTGTTNVWARLEMVNDASFLYYNANTEFTCRYYDAAAPNNTPEYLAATMKHVSYVEYWDLERTYDTANNAQCNVRLYWENSTRSGITDNDHLLLAHFNSSAGYYQDQSGVASGSSAGYITSTVPLTSFSPFTFASDTISTSGVNPLPIELLTFDAEVNGGVVEVAWTTVSETNNDFFTVERTLDGIHFEVVGTIDGAGNSTGLLNYMFVDVNPYTTVSYYRLKQTDHDGHVSYSKLQEVNFEEQTDLSFTVYPNPSDGNTFNLVLNSDRSEDVLFNVQDMYGNIVYSEEIALIRNSENVYPVNLSQQLIQGIYMITVTSSKGVSSSRFIVN